MALMNPRFILIILCIVSITIGGNNEFYKKELFSTKTPYFWARNATSPIPDDALGEIVQGNQTCSAVCIDVVIRHGARYPSLKWIKRFSDIQQKLNGTGTAFIDNWINRFPESKQEEISSVGQREMYYLGKRFATRFSSLLQQNFNQIKSISSKSNRTIDSASYFSNGLSEAIGVNLTLTNVQNQTLIRFYDFCDKYIKTVDENDTALIEYDRFKEGQEIASVLKDVSSRVSSGMFNLTIDEVEIIQQLCAMELQFFLASDWCSFLTEDNLQTIDYMDDIENYWDSAYGYPINYEMSCPLIQHIFRHLDNAIGSLKKNNTYTVATFQFGHSSTVYPLYAAFGLFKDAEALTAKNYATLKNRKFVSSKILPFSANIAFVLYRCSDTEEYLLKILVNEEEVLIPACNATVCPYDVVRQSMADYVDRCNFESRCKDTTVSTASTIFGHFFVHIAGCFFLCMVKQIMFIS